MRFTSHSDLVPVPWYGSRALKMNAVQTHQCPELKIFINSQEEEKLVINVEVVLQQLVEAQWSSG